MATGFKSGGRQAGTPNKITQDARERLYAIMDAQVDVLLNSDDLVRLRASNEVLRTILPYVLPRLKDATGETLEPVIVQIHGNL